MTPALACVHISSSAARATCAPGCGSDHGSAWIPRAIAPSSSQYQEGSSSTWSIRSPKRSCVRSRGSLRSARRPWACASADSATTPASRTRSNAQPAPSRASASPSAGSSARKSTSSKGTDWFIPSSLFGPDLLVAESEVDDLLPRRRGDLAAVDVALGLVDDHRGEQLRVVGGRKVDERRDVELLGVLAVDRLLRRARLAGGRVPGD